NVLNTIMEGIFIRRMPAWIDAALIIAFGLLLSLTVPRMRVLAGAGMVFGFVVLYSVTAFLSFTHAGLWLELVAPLMTLIIGYLVLTIYGYIIKEQEKEFVQGAFGHYLSPAVVDQIMTNPDMIGQLGGEERVMTAFFSDLASFSTISECLTPAELVAFINEYLSEMCDIIEAGGGTIDKFEGDAIVAFFGAPLYYEDHAIRACMSCIDQQRAMIQLRQRWHAERSLPTALLALRDRWEQQGRPFCHVRIGLAAGPMVVGNMGSRSRTDYTMMGDTVNLAARFESGQKIYGTGTMVNEAIYEQVADQVEARRLDYIQVMGKEEPATAYEILERKGELTQIQTDVLGLYHQGLELYDRFEFAEAQARFEEAVKVDPDDGPSALYADRCEDYAQNPPKDLVFRADSK
ncbi:MAG: adenylate/guanylate cyclase domain-containing protein, partial [Gemmatimonadetes bacterium]|nr:adenylate/guanylate cyclase domain-containing protein [Gemmatimonadota bacterium]